MCGIVGIMNTSGGKVERSILEKMNFSIKHRGPTDGGVFLTNSVGLGNRRLAIIDIKGGNQPMSNEKNNIIITYNGELYNYIELRNELLTKGFVFKTNSDTEVILHAYEAWDKFCVERFRGMFAFAILDRMKNEIFIARDQLGIKPLFFTRTSTFFAFASEIQAFQEIPGMKFEIDLEALDQYLFLQYIPAPKTIFKNIFKLKPAHRMIISFDGQIIGPERYWKITYNPNFKKKEVEWLTETEEIIKESVKSHLISDVPFGAFLSGGIDSSCVVTFISQLINRPIKTFTIGFDDEDFNEVRYSQIVSNKWGTEHYFEILKPNAFDILPSLVKHYGEPFGDSSAVPTYYVSELAQRHVPMVLSGDGGDELFAGYGTYIGWLNILSGNNKPLWRKIGRKFGELLYPSRYPPKKANIKLWLSIINYLNYQSRLKLWRKEFHQNCKNKIDEFDLLFNETIKYELCSKVQYMDLNTYLPYDILTKVDVASMMHGLETRTPLVDVKVVEFATTIPQSWNISKEINGEIHGKKILKKIMAKYFTDEFINRPKMGFSIPAHKWLFPKGEKNNPAREILLDKNSKIYTFFEENEIKKIIDNYQTGPIWLLLFLNEWLKQYK